MTLKPCPFCGKTEIQVLNWEEINGLENEQSDSYAAVCDFNLGGCGATGGFRETPEEAAEVWNRRS